MRYKLPLLCLSTLAVFSFAGMAIGDTASAPAAPSNFTIQANPQGGGKFDLTFNDLSNANTSWRVRLFSVANSYGTLSVNSTNNTVTSSTGAAVVLKSPGYLSIDDLGNDCMYLVNQTAQLALGTDISQAPNLVATIQSCVNDTCSSQVLSNVLKGTCGDTSCTYYSY